MNFKQMHVKRVLLGITVTIKMILVTLQAICVPMGFIVPMEQGMQLSLVVQMEHMEMEHSYSILISVSSVHLENSAMVRVAKKTDQIWLFEETEVSVLEKNLHVLWLHYFAL